KACVLPENPASYRVVRTKSYLFNKADHAAKIRRSPSSASLRLGMEGGQGILQKGNSRMLLSNPVGINDLARRKSV
ncbi:hypothetical protein PO615_22920, partial [Klebsiella pneumoniae]